MYSVDHPAAGRSMQQSWDLLAPLLKQGRQFTFGFMNQRVLLNSSLVTQTNLTHLEVEFTKREIAAITFQAGVTLKDFKRAPGAAHYPAHGDCGARRNQEIPGGESD